MGSFALLPTGSADGKNIWFVPFEGDGQFVQWLSKLSFWKILLFPKRFLWALPDGYMKYSLKKLGETSHLVCQDISWCVSLESHHPTLTHLVICHTATSLTPQLLKTSQIILPSTPVADSSCGCQTTPPRPPLQRPFNTGTPHCHTLTSLTPPTRKNQRLVLGSDKENPAVQTVGTEGGAQRGEGASAYLLNRNQSAVRPCQRATGFAAAQRCESQNVKRRTKSSRQCGWVGCFWARKDLRTLF